MPSPFIIIDWKDDFMAALADLVRTSTDGTSATSVLVLPHRRTKRYARNAFNLQSSPNARPSIPRMLTVGELFDFLADECSVRRLKDANMLDKIAILHDIVTGIGTGDLAALNESEFYPWGLRMANIFDECAANDVTPTDLQYVDDLVVPFAANILRSFGDIFVRYRARLAAAGLSSPSLRASDVAAAIRNRSMLPPPLNECSIFLCGLGIPNGTENIVFKALWNAGATIVLQGDASLAEDKPTDAACEPLRRWIDDWHAGRTVYRDAPQINQDILYFAGHDLHSQLHALHNDLEREIGRDYHDARPHALHNDLVAHDKRPRTAVVLTHEAPLIPTLRTLAMPTCNVSMGYPLRDTRVASLLDNLATLETNRRPDGTVYWRDLLTFFHHPYIRILLTADESAIPMPQGPESSLRSGHSYVAPKDALAAICSSISADKHDSESTATRLNGILETLHGVTTTRIAAARLSSLCDVLDKIRPEHLFLEDRAAICKLRTSVIPTLTDTIMADRPLSETLIMHIVTTLVNAQRIPFKTTFGDGVQVLGMLETRLIKFDRVYLLEATEDHLPGIGEQDALLPDSLRNVLGLPTTYERESAVAYTFGRLIAGAGKIRIYWQEGGTQAKGTAGRKTKSRFVEMLIWQYERQHKCLLTHEGRPLHALANERQHKDLPTQKTSPLRSSTMHIVCPSKPSADIPRGEAQNAAVRMLLAAPVSATALNDYLRCPVGFAYKRLCRICPLQEADEGTESLAVGTLMHETLQKAFEPYLGQYVPLKEPTPEKVREIFLHLLEEKDIRSILQIDEFVILREVGPERLRRYLTAMERPAQILRLEDELKAGIDLCGETVTLHGKFDRIERRGDDIVVLDYKTGRIPTGRDGFWTDEAFWARAGDILTRAERDRSSDPFAEDETILQEIRNNAASLQLPCYLYLARKAFGRVGNAAFISLVSDGKEIPFLKEDTNLAHRAEIIDEKIPTLLRLILLHMKRASMFRANPDAKHCAYCGAARFCAAAQI